MAQMLMGSFRDKSQADRALMELEDQGYRPEEISVISGSKDYADRGYDDKGKNVAAAAGSGAVTGGVVGGLAGLLAGAGVWPALAGLFIGGPIAAALGLAGAAATTASGVVTGAAAGGLIGALTGLGLSKETAASYDETVREGGIVLGVSSKGEMPGKAQEIMERCGAEECNVVTLHETEPAETHAEPARETIETPRATRKPAFGESRDEFTGQSEDSATYAEPRGDRVIDQRDDRVVDTRDDRATDNIADRPATDRPDDVNRKV